MHFARSAMKPATTITAILDHYRLLRIRLSRGIAIGNAGSFAQTHRWACSNVSIMLCTTDIMRALAA